MEYHVETIESKCEVAALKVNDMYVHSKFDPIKEAKRIVQKEFKKNHTQIVFGYGLGYIVDELLNVILDEKIIIVDPLIEKGELSLQTRHHDNKKIMYWAPSTLNTLAYTLKQAKTIEQKVNVISTVNYNLLFKLEYKTLLEEIRNCQIKDRINTNTVVLFSKEWQGNLTKNTPYIIKDASLMDLFQKFKAPIVVASGGPSLTKQLSLLKQYEQHMIIIAAGSTINSLLAANIEPDFVVSIDGGIPNYNHFKNLKCENTRLIYSTFNHYGIRPVFKKRAYVFEALNHPEVQQYFAKQFSKSMPLLVGGGTVAHFSYSVAHTFDAGPIAFIGQDLAYTDGKSHAENNSHYEMINKNTMDLMTTEGYYGEELETSNLFFSMKTTFEEIVRFHDATQKTFNCTEGGVKIQGMEQLPFEQFISDFVDENYVKDFSHIDDVEESIESDELVINQFEKEITILDKLIDKTEKAKKALLNNKSKTTFSQKTLSKLDKIDKFIEKETKNVQIHYLVQPIHIEVNTLFLEPNEETPEQKYIRVLNQSKALYSKLQDAFKVSKENLQSVINELKGEN